MKKIILTDIFFLFPMKAVLALAILAIVVVTDAAIVSSKASASASANASDSNTSITVKIKDINLIGATKTKKSALIRVAGIKIGSEMNQQRLEVVRELLSQQSQYNLKRVDFNWEEGILTIVIEDKWSTIPVPMITQSGYYFSRGVLIYESNFLGELATLVPAIAWTNSGIQGLVGYKDEALWGDNIGFKAIAIRKSDLSKFQRGRDTVDTFESRLTALLMTPNYNTGKHVFKAGPVFFLKQVFDGTGKEVFSRQSTALQLRYHYNAKSFGKTEVYFSGHYVTYNSFIVLSKIGGKLINLHDFQWDTSYPIGDNFLNFIFLIRTANDDSYLYPDLLGGKEGFRGYDSMSLPTYRYASGTFQYQQKVWKRLYSDFFYEPTSAELIEPVKRIYGRARITEHSVGAGLRYYFQKITIPALVVEYARNITDKSNHYHFNLGLSL